MFIFEGLDFWRRLVHEKPIFFRVGEGSFWWSVEGGVWREDSSCPSALFSFLLSPSSFLVTLSPFFITRSAAATCGAAVVG
jgi:hypothetical protein